MDSHSESEEQKPPKQLTDARHEFDAYLKEKLVPGHYLSVSSREAPLRRSDGDKVTASAQLAVIRDRFIWDDVQSRWIRNDGGRIVTEDDIYNIILSFQRGHKNDRDQLSYHIRRKMDGVHSNDVKQAVRLWKEHYLGSLDVVDDNLWGGSAAVYEPKSISPSADPDDLEDPRYPTPGKDLHSNTGARSNGPQRPEEAASGVFHPDHPDWLHIGTCKDDGTDIWLSLIRRSGSQAGQLHPVFHDSSAKTINELTANIVWREEFEYSNFPGTRSQQKRAQRTYLHDIIQNQKGDPVPPPRSTGRTSVSGKHPSKFISRARIPATQDMLKRAALTDQSRAGPTPKEKELEHAQRSTMAASTPTSPPTAANKKRRRKTYVIELGSASEDERRTSPRPTKRTTLAGDSFVNLGSLNPILPKAGPPNILKPGAGHGHDPQSTTFEGLSSNAIAGTSLLVSAEHQPGRAPANVPLDDYRTQEQLFETLVIECNLKGRAATELLAVSATYNWNQKQHLIRKGRPRDWSIVCEDIRKAWEREASKFAEDGCEIKMMVHVEA